MRLGFGVALLLAATLSGSAFADNIVAVDVTGTLPDGTSPLTSSFTLNLNNSTVDSTSGLPIYTFTDSGAMVNGSTVALTVNVSQSFDGNTVELMDSMFDETFDFAMNGATSFFDPTVPTFNPGMYSGFDFTNFNSAELTASSVTPEPTSFALFATGLLGMGGLVRRRFLA